MHTKYVDLARDAICYRDPAQDDGRRGCGWCVALALLGTMAFWCAFVWWL
jgi:hypothetical protein